MLLKASKRIKYWGFIY